MNFLKRIFSPSFIIFSSILLIYTFYRSEIIYEGERRNYYNIYYAASLLLITFSIISFYISNKFKEYLIIIFSSLVVSIYAFEGYLIKKHNVKYQIYERDTGKKFDRREHFEVYDDLKKENNQIAVSIRGKLIENEDYSIYSLAGISNSKTILCNENGYYPIYESDRYGFNNPDKEWDSEEIEYLLVGDSYTYGSCVNRPNDIGSVLRSLSNNKSVLNLGYRGNGPLIEYAAIKEYLSPKVKKVLWIYYANDLNNLSTEKNEPILMNYFNDTSFTQKLKLKQDVIDEHLKKEWEKRRKKIEKVFLKKGKKTDLKHFIKFYNLRMFIVGRKEQKPPALPVDFKRVLEQAQEITKKNNSKLYFIHLPHNSRYINSRNKTEINKKYTLIKNIVEELKIPFIDIHKEVFKKEKNPLKLFPFEQNNHYTVEGYKKIAESIYNITKSK